jgi:hypothetical protein
MADAPKLTMDKAGLQAFIDNDVKPFLKEIEKLSDEDSFGPSVWHILGKKDYANTDLLGLELPLSVGLMTGDSAKGLGDVKAGPLSDQITKLAEGIITILETHKELFEEVIDALETTMEKLLKQQGDNLTKIDGEKFVDIFEDVDEILSGSSGGGGDDEE